MVIRPLEPCQTAVLATFPIQKSGNPYLQISPSPKIFSRQKSKFLLYVVFCADSNLCLISEIGPELWKWRTIYHFARLTEVVITSLREQY